MKKRYIYVLLVGVPGFLVSMIISAILSGAAAGLLWIYVFGDDTWPASAETMLPVLFILAFFALLLAFIVIGFITGKYLEREPELNMKHVLASVGVTVVSISLIILYQLSVGNIGPISDTVLCAEFCREQGYSASGMPPKDSGERSCICFDRHGQEIMKVPMDGIAAMRDNF